MVGGDETLLGSVTGMLEGESRTATGPDTEKVDVGIERVSVREKVAVGDEDDGVVRAEVSERGDHEPTMGSVLWFSTVSTERSRERRVVGSEWGESNGVDRIASVDDEERRESVAIDDPFLDGIELVLGQMHILSLLAESGRTNRVLREQQSFGHLVCRKESTIESTCQIWISF